jgi:DNA-binding NtrC family response regulator
VRVVVESPDSGALRNPEGAPRAGWAYDGAKAMTETARAPREKTQILKVQPPVPPAGGAWLVVEVSGGGERWTEIGEQPLIVGSGTDCQVSLDDPHVSHHHAELSLAPGGVMLRDLGSSNGTRVANIAIKEVVLSSGAQILVGTTRLRFELGGEGGNPARLMREPVRDEELGELPPRFGAAVGTATVMRRLFALLGRIAPTDLTITLIGETGTGKDVLAHAIHDASPRREAPFAVFDCAAVPPSLIESELFGHEKGAFTGATSARAGVFERAHGGTLFIDEIGELPLDLQPKLLRALEQRQVQRLGGGNALPFDARIIAATNRDLSAAVEAGRFRQDLFFRLSTAVLQVPPLRDRLDDLPELVAHFLKMTGRTLSVTPAALALLRAHPWPGNVRELKNAIASAAALATGTELDVKDLVFLRAGAGLPPLREAAIMGDRTGDKPGPQNTPASRVPGGSLQAQERLAIQRALTEHGGNRTHAARALGIATSTLYTKLKKYGLDSDEP